MDVRKETLTGMLRTTGSKRVSVIIQDKKGRYLIAEKAGVEEEPIEFPSFSCKDAKLPEGDEGIKLVTEGIKEVIGIEIKNPKLIETFFDDEYPFYHYIFRVEKYSGSPVKGYYDVSIQVRGHGNHTREERGLLGKPSRVGAGEISTGKAPRERRGGHACKIAKWMTGGIFTF